MIKTKHGANEDYVLLGTLMNNLGGYEISHPNLCCLIPDYPCLSKWSHCARQFSIINNVVLYLIILCHYELQY